MTELILRRHMAETPAFFDLQRTIWRQKMRKQCPQPKRSTDGRYAR